MVSTNQGLPAEAFLLERRLRMVDRKVRGLLILAGLFALTTVIMSLYSISTAHWSLVDVYGVGLFQTCSFSNCRQNQYGEETGLSSNGTLILSNRFYNAGPLAIVGVFLQMIIVVLCFLTAFVVLPPKPLLTCYIVPVLTFIAFLFQFFTLTEGSNGIYLNGRSVRVFDATVILLVVQMFLSLLAADRIHHLMNLQYV